MKCVIVTGMSGAGKASAMKMLEDMGYFCIDNMPILLLENFADLALAGKFEMKKVALGLDVRSGYDSVLMEQSIERLKEKKIFYQILFMDASDECLIKRYKETRRIHPLAGNGRVERGIALERELMANLKAQADFIFDTSQLLTRELRSNLEHIFMKGEAYSSLMVTVLSFGFKYGIPSDSDLVFDVRFLPNPYYIEELKPQTGNDAPVRDFVMGFEASQIFLDKLVDMVRFLIPKYIAEGKNQLIIGIGCTGGKHRSVTLANGLYDVLLRDDREYGIKIEHRDIEKDAHRKG
ncbi:MAG: RNase adapter RapZ [Lachnospiraceae bacterium]|nr:RNase adapter RapZ [Lachnospiraceae bacterium]